MLAPRQRHRHLDLGNPLKAGGSHQAAGLGERGRQRVAADDAPHGVCRHTLRAASRRPAPGGDRAPSATAPGAAAGRRALRRARSRRGRAPSPRGRRCTAPSPSSASPACAISSATHAPSEQPATCGRSMPRCWTKDWSARASAAGVGAWPSAGESPKPGMSGAITSRCSPAAGSRAARPPGRCQGCGSGAADRPSRRGRMRVSRAQDWRESRFDGQLCHVALPRSGPPALVLAMLVFVLALPSAARASSPNVVISEVQATGVDGLMMPRPDWEFVEF